ncbi:type II toxin-antitoxin system Phd/YefM family antitoxin [Aerosakkonema sp. BLCC-F183]|uniref:type II toxin-antitoxin system Phd/YefM family antitoxin n=1 Tax=Aerosakkonema sp. BLCC-F183 TaxID=3342834 RepID=UPI0035BB3A96
MKEVTMAEVQESLLEYLQIAEQEGILITHQGKPVGILLGLQSEEDLADYQLENDPRFLKRIAAARKRLRSGEGIRLEDIKWE